MKTIQIEKFGIDNLIIKEVEIPKIGPDEILVKVNSFSLNYMDILLIEGNYNPELSLPHIPGSDASGVIAEIGKNVNDFQLGDEVITHFFIDWQSGVFKKEYFNHRYGSEGRGVFTEYIVVSSNGLIHKPKHLSFEEASTLPIAGLTAWSSLVEEMKSIPGQSVLILGTGGVSVFAIQIAKLLGLHITVVTSSKKKSEKALSFGAHHVINYRSNPDWEKRSMISFQMERT